MAFLILFGIGWGFFDCNNMPILCQITRPELRATGYGIMNLVSISCGGFGDWGFGVLRDQGAADAHLRLLRRRGAAVRCSSCCSFVRANKCFQMNLPQISRRLLMFAWIMIQQGDLFTPLSGLPLVGLDSFAVQTSLNQRVQLLDQPAELRQGGVDASGFSMSTPASRSRSSGSFEQPPLRKLEVVVQFRGARRRCTRSARAIAADMPVAYL